MHGFNHLVLLFVLLTPVLAADERDFDAGRTAQELLNDATESARRDLLVSESVPHAAAVIVAMTKDLPKEQPEEYRRIPWIWRVAVAAGKQNDDEVLRDLLAVSLPEDDGPLADWQAVVIGGGIINGVSQAGDWPAERIEQLLPDESAKSRWTRTVGLAARMVENEETPTGTRYDALRILGADNWEAQQALITKYLAADANDELQMGAVSAAGDLPHDEAAQTLLKSLPELSAGNRALAIDALLRTPQRRDLLRTAMDMQRVKKDWFTGDQLERLNDSADQ